MRRSSLAKCKICGEIPDSNLVRVTDGAHVIMCRNEKCTCKKKFVGYRFNEVAEQWNQYASRRSKRVYLVSPVGKVSFHESMCDAAKFLTKEIGKLVQSGNVSYAAHDPDSNTTYGYHVIYEADAINRYGGEFRGIRLRVCN